MSQKLYGVSEDDSLSKQTSTRGGKRSPSHTQWFIKIRKGQQEGTSGEKVFHIFHMESDL